MSGFVGVISVDDAPVDRRLLQQMTDSLIYRGPDAQDLWIDGSVGFGHAMFRTTPESQCEHQPHSLDGAVWITGDVYIDGRADLIKRLESEGCRRLQTAPDAELVLHAYQTWGEHCTEHLLGDFAYAIWDRRTKRLFCARDYFGVKPFYYAQTARCLVFSNTLNCIRLHPAVSGELNDRAIGDFLLVGYNREPSTTTFADVQRLPPAHALTWSGGSLRLRRYWTLPAGQQIVYRRRTDYVDHFRELWLTAVQDRVPTERIAVLMSGGLDSTSVAATAHRILTARAEPSDLRAYTLVYDRLIPHGERHYAGLMAEALGIPIHYLPADDYTLFDRCSEVGCQTPEPSDNPLPAIASDVFRLIARRCRFALSGDGGDPALFPSPASHFINLVKAGSPSAAIADVVRCLTHGQRPPFGIRAALRYWRGNDGLRQGYPPWVSQDFAARVNLRARWEELHSEPMSLDPLRPGAYHDLHSPFWPSLFEAYDPGVTSCQLEFRHPFFDIRLLTYLLSVPPMPWFLHKKLLRDAMRGWLPEPIRRRPKTPMAADPISALLRQPQPGWPSHFDETPELAQYVDRAKIPAGAGLPSQVERYGSNWPLLTRPLCLNHWLAHTQSPKLATKKGISYGNV
jgi:asparagine synthase (glutamine-hydrolysing)